jgi:serine/threonine protein kinase
MAIAAGSQIGRYEIRAKIGEGGMGEVYLAEDTRLHRSVAIKILPANLANNRDRMRRFEQEAQAAAALNHPIASGTKPGRYQIRSKIVEADLRARGARSKNRFSESRTKME